jgi:hypothetical protein
MIHRYTNLESAILAKNRHFNIVFGHFSFKPLFERENRNVDGILQLDIFVVSLTSGEKTGSVDGWRGQKNSNHV